MPCQAIKESEVLFYESQSKSKGSSWGGSPDRQQHRSKSISPVRRPHTLSPNKELTSRTTENTSQGKRSIVSLKPGMKPIPTSTYSYGSKTPGFVGGSQPSSSVSRMSANLALARSSYLQERAPLTRSPIKSSIGTAGEKQDTKQSSKSKSEQNTGSIDTGKANKSGESSVASEKQKEQIRQRSPKTPKGESKLQASNAAENKGTEASSSKAMTKEPAGEKQAVSPKSAMDGSEKNKDTQKVKKSAKLNSDQVTEEGTKSINTDSSVSTKMLHAHGTSSKKPVRSTIAEERASRGS